MYIKQFDKGEWGDILIYDIIIVVIVFGGLGGGGGWSYRGWEYMLKKVFFFDFIVFWLGYFDMLI